MNGLLRKTAEMAKTGNGDAYEDFYILTVDRTYGKIRLLSLSDAENESILADVYTNLYRHVHDLPLEEEIFRAAGKLLGTEPERVPLTGDFPKLAEDTAAGVWIRVENRTGLYSDRHTAEKTPWYAWAAMGVRILAAVLCLVLIAMVFYMLWRYIMR